MELVAKKVYTTLKCVMQIHLQGEDWMRLRLSQSTVDEANHSGFGDPKEAKKHNLICLRKPKRNFYDLLK